MKEDIPNAKCLAGDWLISQQHAEGSMCCKRETWVAKEREGLEACFEASHSKFEFDMIPSSYYSLLSNKGKDDSLKS